MTNQMNTMENSYCRGFSVTESTLTNIACGRSRINNNKTVRKQKNRSMSTSPNNSSSSHSYDSNNSYDILPNNYVGTPSMTLHSNSIKKNPSLQYFTSPHTCTSPNKSQPDFHISNPNNKIKKRGKTVKYETHVFTCNDEPLVASKRKVIAKYDLLRVLHLPQTLASQVLGCSFSTLKRRFYESKTELGIEKWPQFYHEVRNLPIFEYIYPMSLTFILNPENRSKSCSTDLSPPFISDSEVKTHFLQVCSSKQQ